MSLVYLESLRSPFRLFPPQAQLPLIDIRSLSSLHLVAFPFPGIADLFCLDPSRLWSAHKTHARDHQSRFNGWPLGLIYRTVFDVNVPNEKKCTVVSIDLS